MTVPTETTTLPAAAGGPAPVAPPVSAAARERVKLLAQEFEALLMSQMLSQMRKSMLGDEEEREPGLGAGNMTETIDTALAASLSKSGGFGIADVLLRGLDRQFPTSTGEGAPGAAGPVTGPVAGPAPLSVPAAAPVARPALPSTEVAIESGGVMKAPTGRISSAFGWRADPINGQARFHKGTDIALAYGHEVQAAAGGRVAFAGEQPGYGLTVVIDHGAGLETRYAHLSGYSVRVGDTVGSGQVVARSGNSGRSTGPHLHFEVLQGGRAVDPASLASVRS